MWDDEGDAPAVDQAAVEEWVGVLSPADQVSMSVCASMSMFILGKSSLIEEAG